MRKKITYCEPPTQSLPTTCEICGDEISSGDECWYVGQGVYVCLQEECLKKWEE